MIYLDYNATAPLKPAVQRAVEDALRVVGNPSSIHGYGRNARRIIEGAREAIATLIQCDPTYITFTSGATEANNTVLRNAPVERIILSAIEHPSVGDIAQDKIKETIPVLPNGLVDLKALETLLAASSVPTLVSVMLVNNETGVIQPVAEIAHIVRNSNALLHVDAVQAIGKMPVDFTTLDCDYLSISAHKMGGPAGIGALVYAHDKPLLQFMQGGGQERRRRAGTENLIGIAGFGGAAADVPNDAAHLEQLRVWQSAMEHTIRSAVPQAIIFGADAPRLGNTTQIALPGATSEKQLIALDLAGFAVSSGSACSSGSVKPSHVLKAMGVPDDIAKCAIRISSGWATTEQDLQDFAAAYIKMAGRLIS